MNDKIRYFQAMKVTNGHFEEIELGEKLGLDKDTTRKIEYTTNRACNYRII